MKQENLNLGYHESFSEEDFFVAPGNCEAFELVKNKSGDESPLLLAIYGVEGSGKTHLSHIFAKNHNAMFIDIKMLANKQIHNIIAKSESFVIDGIDDKEYHDIKMQELLFHLLNDILNGKKNILITSSSHPAHLHKSLPDLNSRLALCAAIEVGVPDDDLLHAILMKQFSDRQISVSGENIKYILSRVPRNASYLKNLVMKIDDLSMQNQKKIALPLIKEVINSLNDS